MEYLLLKCETIKIYVLDLKDNSCKIQDMKIISIKISSESDNIYKNYETFTANIYIYIDIRKSQKYYIYTYLIIIH